jgi:hypothetical protein
LTAEGRKLLSRAAPAWQQAQRRATEVLGETVVARLNEAAGKMGFPPDH